MDSGDFPVADFFTDRINALDTLGRRLSETPSVYVFSPLQMWLERGEPAALLLEFTAMLGATSRSTGHVTPHGFN